MKNSHHYLIGPKWYDHYYKVITNLLYYIPFIVGVVMLAVELVEQPGQPAIAVASAIGTAFSVAIHIVFWVTAIFVMLERSGTDPETLVKNGTFATFESKPVVTGKRQINRYEPVFNIIFILIGTAWIASSPIFNPALQAFWIPAMFVAAALTVLHEGFQFVIGKWVTPLMVTNVLLSAVSIIALLILFSTQSIINPELLQAIADTTKQDVNSIRESVQWAVAITAAVTIAVYVWDAMQSVILNRKISATRRD